MAKKQPKEVQGTKGKHLTEEERMEIQECLGHGMSFKEIGRRIGKDQTTISREVKRHIVVEAARKKTDAERPLCNKLLKPPFVCNACKIKHSCLMKKHMYYGRKAHKVYSELLSDSRTGIALHQETFYADDAILKAGVEKGQHIYHIAATNDLHVSLPTIYRYINRGYSAVSRIDLPRAVKFKPRKQYRTPSIPALLKQGRTYDCFLEYIQENNMHEWLEMDTVIGRVGGKVLLTFTFSNGNFMFARLCEDKSARAIACQLRTLKQQLHRCSLRFGDIFPVVLTDNGSEFSDVSAVETDAQGEQECHLFFCDPYRSCEKPHIEKQHTLLRDILPKGSSFDDLTQDTVDLICSHINAVKRKELHGKSAFDMFCFLFGETVAQALGCCYIDPKDVIQSPKLLPNKEGAPTNM